MFSMCMKQMNLKIKLVSEEDNIDIKILGNMNENEITYKEDNTDVILSINKDTIKMNRKNNDYNIELVFNKATKTISTYQVFGGLKTFQLETITKNLNISDKKIEIDYNLEGNDFSYTLEMEDL